MFFTLLRIKDRARKFPDIELLFATIAKQIFKLIVAFCHLEDFGITVSAGVIKAYIAMYDVVALRADSLSEAAESFEETYATVLTGFQKELKQKFFTGTPVSMRARGDGGKRVDFADLLDSRRDQKHLGKRGLKSELRYESSDKRSNRSRTGAGTRPQSKPSQSQFGLHNTVRDSGFLPKSHRSPEKLKPSRLTNEGLKSKLTRVARGREGEEDDHSFESSSDDSESEIQIAQRAALVGLVQKIGEPSIGLSLAIPRASERMPWARRRSAE